MGGGPLVNRCLPQLLQPRREVLRPGQVKPLEEYLHVDVAQLSIHDLDRLASLP